MAIEVVRPPSAPYISAFEVALKYANDVNTGAIVAGKLLKLTVRRFLRDLKRGAERGLTFEESSAQHVVDFFGCLRHSKGEWGAHGGKPFILEPWQVFILANLFGWKRADGTRRFRETYIEIARKNGKSTFIAGIGLYMLVADGEPGAEVYSAAKSKEQARIIFDVAKSMRDKSKFLTDQIEVMGVKKPNNMHVLDSASKFEPLPGEEQGSLDGKNIHCALIDELHAHPDRLLYDALKEATVSRSQPMIIAITTAGYNREGICYKQRSFAESVLTGIIEADKGDFFFAFIACLDEKDAAGNPPDPFDEKNWSMANPNLGVSVKIDALREIATVARHDPTKLNTFLCKHMNVWVNQAVRWMPSDKWAACDHLGSLVPALTKRQDLLKKLLGRKCFGGLDLSGRIDLTAFVLLFPPVKSRTEKRARPQTDQERWARKPVEYDEVVLEQGDPLWYVLPWFWVPKNCIVERVQKDKVSYDVWVREGWIGATDGSAVDQNVLRKFIGEQAQKYQIVEIGFDTWNATQMKLDLEADGFKVEEVRQGFKSQNEPMKELMALVLDKKLEHGGNPVLSWNAMNVQAEMDATGSVKPDKQHSKEKIDGISATINAMNRVLNNPSMKASVYNERGIVFL